MRGSMPPLWLLVAWVLLLAPGAAWANHYRFGVFVGNNLGQPGDPPLMFATSDAEKMRDLFVEYGQMRPQDAVLVADGTSRQVQRAIDQLATRIQRERDDGHETTFVFYYSGHGDADALHMGTTKVNHVNLRTWIDRTGADVRLALIDACQSGGMVRKKGGVRGPSFDFGVEVERTRGTAVLTSSAASELSQESVEVGGGFFTHYLHTALTGGADRNRDGMVTLSEAYAYVHTETAFSTRDTPGAQTPSFDFDLVGSGELALTELEEASSYLSFLGDLDGTYSVWDESRKRYVAEVDGSAAMQLAVRPGTYYVHNRMPGWVDEARYSVRRGETLAVHGDDFTSVSYESVASRGDLERVARRARMPDLTLRLVVGVRTFGSNSVYDQEYVPAHGIGGVAGRFIGQRKTWWGFDVLTGGGASDLTFEEVGTVAVRAGSTSAAGSVGFATKPALLRAGIGARTELIRLSRSFVDRDEPDQASGGLASGGTTWVGLHHGRFTGDLEFGLLMLFNSFDDRNQWPLYSELTLHLGYRF